MEEKISNTRKKSVIFLVLTAILWSTGGLFIKLIPWNPIAISGFRALVAFVTLILFWRFRYGAWPPVPNKSKIYVAVNYMALTTLFVICNKLTTSANAILLQYTAPGWVMVLSAVFYGQKIKKRDAIAVVIIFAGMTLFFKEGLSGGGALGNILSVVCGILMANMILLMQRVKDGHPLETVIWGNLLGFLVGIPFFSGIQFTPMSLGAGLFLGMIQIGLAYLLYTVAIRHVTAMEAILIPVIEPLLNPFWVMLFTGEKPSVYAVIGGALVLSAVVLRSVLQEMENKAIERKFL